MSGGVPILMLENDFVALFAIKAGRFIACGHRPDVADTQCRNPGFQLAQQSGSQSLSAIGFLYKEVRQIKPSIVVVSVLVGQATGTANKGLSVEDDNGVAFGGLDGVAMLKCMFVKASVLPGKLGLGH